MFILLLVFLTGHLVYYKPFDEKLVLNKIKASSMLVNDMCYINL